LSDIPREKFDGPTEIDSDSLTWSKKAISEGYMHRFSWFGRPVIQFPQDLIAIQEIVFEIKPDLVIETGIAHGGSLAFTASLLELNTFFGGPKDASVLGIDIDIRSHNLKALNEHPLRGRINFVEGDSTDPDVINRVKKETLRKKTVMVILDSNHTEDHVLSELLAYADLVSVGSYCVVLDTIIEFLPEDFFPDRPWSPGNNPYTALQKFLSMNKDFLPQNSINQKIGISAAPGGYLLRKN
jgi:cephalosporin hydroxylase